MIKRTIEVSTPGTHIKTAQRQLVFVRDGQDVGRVPCEDLGVLIVDEQQVTCSQAALVAAAEAGAVVLFCGDNHHPAAMLLPVEGNQLLADRIRLQAEAKKPLAKRLWQQLVQAKLRRQADRVPPEHPAHARLRYLAKNVAAGDAANAEGQGARVYWPALFGETFRRDRDGAPPNNLLNYGYMVLRAAMARAVCGGGLHPAFGLHHHHRNNTFCLADDLLEPYRPFVDARVVELWQGKRDDIGRETKAHLLQVLTDEVIVAGRKGPLLIALSKTVSSLVDCLAGEREKLDLPQP